MDEVTQITFRELLQDPTYRAWFQKKPAARSSQSWRVYVQEVENGLWKKKDFDRWRLAYEFVLRNYKDWHDCALNSRVWDWRPPIVKFKAEVMLKNGQMKKVTKRKYYAPMLTIVGHHWCPHCRRPTVFRPFYKHHALGQLKTNRKPRCTICGISETGIKKYQPREEEDAT
jgi:hypothetical protein